MFFPPHLSEFLQDSSHSCENEVIHTSKALSTDDGGVQVLSSLAFLHGLGLIHCDLKPENIMVADFEVPRVKLIDLGSSCFLHDRLASYVQSRSYRAPEVVLRCGYNHKIDIWSLGCILAELHTGSVLFQVRRASSFHQMTGYSCILSCSCYRSSVLFFLGSLC